MHKVNIIILLFAFLHCIYLPANGQNIDIEILRNLHKSSSTIHSCSEFISGTTQITAVSVPVVMTALSLIQKNDRLLKDAVYVGASMAVNTVFTYGLKYGIDRKRPYLTYSDLNVPVRLYERSPSFPSGHTSLAFSTATALSLKYPQWYVIVPAYLWAGSVGYSRMNLGVHYPSDVVAGALLGVGSAYLTYKINRWIWQGIDAKRKKTDCK